MAEKLKKMEMKSVAKDARWISVCMHYLPELEPDYESLNYARFKPAGGGRENSANCGVKSWEATGRDASTRVKT
jgi:hypothetical protein